MAAFSYEFSPYLVDHAKDEFFSSFNQYCNSSAQLPFYNDLQEGSTFDVSAQSSCIEQQSAYNETSVTEKQRTESLTSMVDKADSGEQVTQKTCVNHDKKRKSRRGSSSNSANSKDARQGKCKKQKEDKEATKDVQSDNKVESKANEEPPKGYIHVRARRGQATDSHSLAERVRREKISKRMKMLQSLVPGCDKVSGKALMLDEIINYVQSLQNQVEFLSMKLAHFDPMVYNFALMDLDPTPYATQGMNNGIALPMPLISSTSSSACSTDHSLAFVEANAINSTTTATTTTTFPSPTIHSSTNLMFQHEQKPCLIPSEDAKSLYWGGVDDQQRHSIFNQFGFGANNLYSIQ